MISFYVTTFIVHICKYIGFKMIKIEWLIYIELNQRYEIHIEKYKVSRNITEKLKEQDQIIWVQEMNNIKDCIEEIIRNVIDWSRGDFFF